MIFQKYRDVIFGRLCTSFIPQFISFRRLQTFEFRITYEPEKRLKS